MKIKTNSISGKADIYHVITTLACVMLFALGLVIGKSAGRVSMIVDLTKAGKLAPITNNVTSTNYNPDLYLK